MNDLELVQAIRQREPAALQCAYDRFLPSLWRYVYAQANGDQHLAEDIVSETMLALVQTVGRPPVEAATEILNPAGWLRTVAANKLKDHFRAAARVRHLLQNAQHVARQSDDPTDPAEICRAAEQRAEVRAAMDRLSDQHRTALEWKYLDKVSVREIARRWSMTEKAVESILFRARGALREQLLRESSAGDRPARNEATPVVRSQTTPGHSQ